MDDDGRLTHCAGEVATSGDPRDLELDPDCDNVTPFPVVSRDLISDNKFAGLTGFCGLADVVVFTLREFKIDANGFST